MRTVLGLRFLRTLAKLGDDIPSYVEQSPKPATQPSDVARKSSRGEALQARILGR